MRIKGIELLFSYLKVASNVFAATYAAVMVALISGIPSLPTGSWQQRTYADIMFYLTIGLIPTVFAALLSGFSTDKVESWFNAFHPTNPRVAKVYIYILSVMVSASGSSLVYSLGYLQGALERGK